jgi:hypothetical protein
VRARALLAAAAALALAGCPLHPRAPQPPPREGEWALLRAAETRRAVLYDGLRHRATATATHLSLPVREARARRLAEWFGWSDEELERRVALERAGAAAGEEFLLSFYTADPRANDLDAPRSMWRVFVRVDGADLEATRVTSIDRDTTILGLFPYVGPFEVAYLVLLPRPTSGELRGRPFVLELASGLGRVSLDWNVAGILVEEPWQPVPPP